MALSLPPDPTPPSEPPVCPPGTPTELDIAGDTTCFASAEERIRPGQDSLDPREHFQGGLRGAESATSAPRFPSSFSYEDPARGRHYEHLIAGCEWRSRTSAYLVWTSNCKTWIKAWDLGYQPSGMVQLQVPWLTSEQLALSGVLAQGSGLQIRASLEQNLSSLGQCLLVFDQADRADQDMEADGDSDGLVGLTTPADLEWDPAGDVGHLGLLSQKAAWTPGAPCELCGHRSSQVSGQDLEDMLMLIMGLSQGKHLPAHRRHSVVQNPQHKNMQASLSPEDAATQKGDHGTPAQASTWPLIFLLFLFLLGAILLLSGGLCCFHTRLTRTPYLVLSYVNGAPPT